MRTIQELPPDAPVITTVGDLLDLLASLPRNASLGSIVSDTDPNYEFLVRVDVNQTPIAVIQGWSDD